MFHWYRKMAEGKMKGRKTLELFQIPSSRHELTNLD
jgi:hypothetical protein